MRLGTGIRMFTPPAGSRGVKRGAKAGLFDLSSFEVLNMKLPVGTYTFYFGLNDPDDKPTGPWWALDSVQVTVRNLPSTFTNSIGQTFVLLPAGTFTMGSPGFAPCFDPEKAPQHQVRLTQYFYMQTTEVTQAQWEAVMGSNPTSFEKCPTCPVDSVSWNDVQAFIVKMNTHGPGTYSLPTEAQWEYAARAGSTTAFYNGGIANCVKDSNLDAIGWYTYNSGGKTHPVAQKTPNPWGLYDMSGNVFEWCQDWYSSSYYSSSPTDDPQGPSSGANRVLRGGGWNSNAQTCRSAIRRYYTPDGRHYFFGFRLMLFPPRSWFTDNGDGTVTDHQTKLIWLQDGNCFGEKNWNDALSACQNLATGSCGLSDGSKAGDWRLPNLNELKSIVDRARFSPAIDTEFFPNTLSAGYWSSTTHASYTNFAMGVGFGGGHEIWDYKSTPYYVRAVRGGQ